MTKAYVFIKARAGKTKDVAKALANLDGVGDADSCWGTPDIIAVVNVKNERALNDLVLNQIQQINGVEHTETHIVLD